MWVPTTNGTLDIYDQQTGALVETILVDSTGVGSASYHEGFVIVPSDGLVHLIDPGSREIISTLPSEFARSSFWPGWTLTDGHLFGIDGGTGTRLEDIDTIDGSSTLVEIGEQLTTPTASEGRVVVPALNAAYVYDPATGGVDELRYGRVTASFEGVELGGLVYVPQVIAGALAVIDPAGSRIVDTIPLTNQRLGQAATDGSRVYVGLVDEGEVVAVDPSSGAVERFTVGGEYPVTVTVNPTMIAVRDPAANLLHIINQASSDISSVTIGSSGRQWIGLGSDEVFIADEDPGTLLFLPLS
jgi:outer membrane protein assembly factor BamB